MKKNFKDLVDYHLENRYWSSANDTRYGYVLCPHPFRLDENHIAQLKEIGIAVADYIRGMKKLFTYASQYQGSHRIASTIYQICEQGSGGMPLLSPAGNVPITKVDCMIDTLGNIRIAEIDAYNPRGLSYVLFLRDIFPEAKNPFCGITDTLANCIGNKELIWVYANRERYYLTAFAQMQRIMRKYNINMHLYTDVEARDFTQIGRAHV